MVRYKPVLRDTSNFVWRRWAAHAKTHDRGAEQNCSFFVQKYRKTSGKAKAEFVGISLGVYFPPSFSLREIGQSP